MRLLLICSILLTGCGATYTFEPFGKGDSSVSRAEIAAALQQRDKALEILAKRLEAVEPKKLEKK